jgi:hypothetical protein
MEARLVERSGPTCLANLRRGDWLVHARLGRPVAERSQVEVEFALASARLFDGATGLALVHARPDG